MLSLVGQNGRPLPVEQPMTARDLGVMPVASTVSLSPMVVLAGGDAKLGQEDPDQDLRATRPAADKSTMASRMACVSQAPFRHPQVLLLP